MADPAEIDRCPDDAIPLTTKTQDTLPALDRRRAAGVVGQPIFCLQNGVGKAPACACRSAPTAPPPGARLVFRPQDATLTRERDPAALPGRIVRRVLPGSAMRCGVAIAGAEVTVDTRFVAGSTLKEVGMPVALTIPSRSALRLASRSARLPQGPGGREPFRIACAPGIQGPGRTADAAPWIFTSPTCTPRASRSGS